MILQVALVNCNPVVTRDPRCTVPKDPTIQCSCLLECEECNRIYPNYEFPECVMACRVSSGLEFLVLILTISYINILTVNLPYKCKRSAFLTKPHNLFIVVLYTSRMFNFLDVYISKKYLDSSENVVCIAEVE